MHRTLWAFMLLPMLLTGLAQGQDAKQVATILDTAITAAGGQAKLAKLQGYSLKLKGTHYAEKQKLPFTATYFAQGPDKGRTVQEIEAMGAKSMDITVVNGTQGWSKSGPTETRPLSKEDLYEEKENLYFSWISTLAPLKAKDFKLTLLDEIKVDGRTSIGFSVSAKGHRDVKLWFDKETGLLAKTERKTADGVEEMFYSNYKDVDGIKMAMKVTAKLDGDAHYDFEITEAKVQEKLDEKLFAKP